MADLFNITHNADNLDEYDSTVTDSGDLSTGTPGLASTAARMEALIDDTTAIYGQVTQAAPGSNRIRLRFYIDPNTLTMADGDNFRALEITGDQDPWQVLVVYFGYTVADGYRIIAYAVDDESNWDKDTGWHVVTDAEHYVEIDLQRESGAAQDDGVLTMWIDGAQEATVTTVDNYTVFSYIDSVRMGATGSIDAGTSGTLYLDELKANDDGGEIGAVAGGVSVPVLAHQQYRLRRVA